MDEFNEYAECAETPENPAEQLDPVVLQMLTQGMQQQRRFVKAYEILAMAADRETRRLIQAMQREDRRHYYLLEGIYEELSGRPFRSPRVGISMPKQYVAMLQKMLKDKLDTIDFYEELLKLLVCEKQRELMSIVLSDQKEQARLLATVYQRSC